MKGWIARWIAWRRWSHSHALHRHFALSSQKRHPNNDILDCLPLLQHPKPVTLNSFQGLNVKLRGSKTLKQVQGDES